jgi:hypothetical protein
MSLSGLGAVIPALARRRDTPNNICHLLFGDPRVRTMALGNACGTGQRRYTDSSNSEKMCGGILNGMHILAEASHPGRSEVVKGIKPTSTIVQEHISFEKHSVESVRIIDKFLKVLQGNLGSEGRALQVLKMVIKAVCPKTNDDVVFVGYIAQRSPNTRSREISRRFSIISERRLRTPCPLSLSRGSRARS